MTTALAERVKSLKSTNWSFPDESSRGDITDLHPYPARFIPPIPESIINAFPKKGLNILDPFAGCGTTLRAGLNAGHSVYGVDVNALAHLLQRVYSYPFSDADLVDFKDFGNDLISFLNKKRVLGARNINNIPNIEHWFDIDAREILATSTFLINRASLPDHISDLLKFSISRIIVKISNQKSDTQYVAIDKSLDRKQIVKILSDSFDLVHKRFTNNKDSENWRGKSLTIQGDARDADSYKSISNIDLVITSPPYPNAYEYWLYHKYRMFWLGLDPLWCRSREIGARPFYSGTGKKNEFDFQNDLYLVFSSLDKITKRDALQFWVVGDSILKGRLIDNTKIVADACAATGWKVIDRMQRIVDRRRSSFQGIGRQDIEHILVIHRS